MSTKFSSEIFGGQQNLGRKFGLAKFYFGLRRFVCVMLLVTAKLNNNNTEFHWWWWWVVGGLHTHNVVKPTSSWLWLSWVLTKVFINNGQLCFQTLCAHASHTDLFMAIGEVDELQYMQLPRFGPFLLIMALHVKFQSI